MAQATFSVRMDETLKRRFDALCAELGMSTTTAFNELARIAVRERRIPRAIETSDSETNLNDGLRAFQALRMAAKENGIQDLTLDEINSEIQAVRNGEVDG